MPFAASEPLRDTKLSRLRRSLARPLTRFVGIDVGVECARVVSLGAGHRDARRESRGTLRWLSRHRLSLPIDPLAPPPTDWVQRVINTLQECLPRCVDGDDCLTALSLPLPWVHYQVVASTELTESQRQCDAMFSSSLFNSNAHVGHWPLTVGDAVKNEHCVIAAVAESAAIDLAEAVSRLGYQIERILPHGVALIAAAQSMTAIDPACVVLLGRNGGLVAMKNETGCGHCRVLPALPDHVIAASRPHGLTLPAIRPWLSDVAAEVTATRRFAIRSQHTPAGDQPVLLCGDIACIPEVDSMLATLLGIRSLAGAIQAKRGHPAHHCSTSKHSKQMGDGSQTTPSTQSRSRLPTPRPFQTYPVRQDE